MDWPVAVAGWGGSLARQTEQLGCVTPWNTHGSAFDVMVLPWNVVVTVAPAAEKPQTVAAPGPRCSTIESCSVALSVNELAADGSRRGVGQNALGSGTTHVATDPRTDPDRGAC